MFIISPNIATTHFLLLQVKNTTSSHGSFIKFHMGLQTLQYFCFCCHQHSEGSEVQ